MPLEHHSLVQEFPDMREQISRMKASDRHFSRLFDEYDVVEHEVHRIEAGAEAASDDRLEALKKRRLSLKDALYQCLREAA